MGRGSKTRSGSRSIRSTTAPTISGLPDVTLNTNGSLDNAVDPYLFADDLETADWSLTYTITGNTNPNVGVSLDAEDYIDVTPNLDWSGFSDVTIRATDPDGLWAEDTFRITVEDTHVHAR